MQQILYDAAPYAILAYPFQLGAYDTADWQGWVHVSGDAPAPQQDAMLYSYNDVDTYRFAEPRAAVVETTASSGTTVVGRNTITDERIVIAADGEVREVAAWGQLVAWTTGPRAAARVWATDRRRQTRYQLSASGTGVAVDRRRVVWASPMGEDESAILAWNRLTRRSVELCRTSARARSLDLEGDLVVWVQESGSGDIWAYDFGRHRAFAVCNDGARQARPVLVGRTVFWADRRSGQWELYGRAVQP